MRILLLNWKNAENDPFTEFNECLSLNFKKFGREVFILNLDSEFSKNLEREKDNGVDFAITWQGLGSSIKLDNTDLSLWEIFQIPLFCLHGDHPSHAPVNHLTDNRYVIHIYGAGSFSRYKNQYFGNKETSIFLQAPAISKRIPISNFSGDFFYFPKNLDDTKTTFEKWKNGFKPSLSKFLIDTGFEIKRNLNKLPCLDHHYIIDNFLTIEVFNRIKKECEISNDFELFNFIHAELDKCFRNMLSEHVLHELPDVPIKIVGRGWDRFKDNNKNHSFSSIDKMNTGDFQFQSNYGIIDISPCHDLLHDRTQRAIGFQCGFLSGSNWNELRLLENNYDDLFFNGTEDNLKSKVERVMRNPTSHREICRDFSNKYSLKFSYYDFLKFFEKIKMNRFY